MLTRKTPLKSKSGMGGGKQKDIDPEYAAWKRERLAHHHHSPTKADRAEFPEKVVKQAIERSGGICQYCKARPCTSTHHVVGRNRSGRGVLSNAYRACGLCHHEIEIDEAKKQELIEQYRKMYGENFWWDEEDWQEHSSKQSKQQAEEQAKQQRLNDLEPVISLLSAATGRKLNSKEVKLIDNLDDREMMVFSKLIADIVKAGPEESFGYGDKFND